MKIRTLLLPLTFALLIGCEDKDDNSTTTGDGVAASDTAGDVDEEGWSDDGGGEGDLPEPVDFGSFANPGSLQGAVTDVTRDADH